MAEKDALGFRMKEYYENIAKFKLMRRTPVAIRIDGKAFHTFTRKFQKPFDEVLIKSMQETMKFLCEHIQGCVLGYTQSDEITLILTDYSTLDACAWFDYEVQKLCSISASMATLAFNKFFQKNVDAEKLRFSEEFMPNGECNTEYKDKALYDLWDAHNMACNVGAMFDARCFNIPKEEVTNLIYWRQSDASRNSVQMLGRAYFSHKALHNKSNSDIQDMLMSQYGVNWNDLPAYKKRGSCCVKQLLNEDSTPARRKWVIDENIPIFVGPNRDYIENLIEV